MREKSQKEELAKKLAEIEAKRVSEETERSLAQRINSGITSALRIAGVMAPLVTVPTSPGQPIGQQGQAGAVPGLGAPGATQGASTWPWTNASGNSGMGLPPIHPEQQKRAFEMAWHMMRGAQPSVGGFWPAGMPPPGHGLGFPGDAMGCTGGSNAGAAAAAAAVPPGHPPSEDPLLRSLKHIDE